MKLNAIRMVMLSAVLGFVCAQLPAGAKDLKELQESFKSRYGKIAELKATGTVGETSDGYVEPVKGAGDAKALIDAENADRKELYETMSKQEGGITPKLVGERNALRNFGKAKPGEFLKKDGKWSKK